MSAIVGLINLDGAPADERLLRHMANQMIGRAPDGIGVWCTGPVGLAHALLEIPGELDESAQPHSDDGRTWIVADARIDGRDDLVRVLAAAGRVATAGASSAALILESYRAFGLKCLEHLNGDFAFALWDADTRTLVVARDHFGVRPLFYARVGNAFLFSSEIFALLAHPAITTTPDDDALGDQLLFGGYQLPETTAYRDIRRFDAAHLCRVTSPDISFTRYWTPPFDADIRYRRDSDYSEHFLELFTAAVRDRTHASNVTFQLTGGMDSTSIAAVVAHAVTPRPAWSSYTVTAERLVPGDQEGQFAALVASHLGMPHVRIASEDYPLFSRFGEAVVHAADLCSAPEVEMHYNDLARMGQEGSRVLFSGLGGDIVCTEAGRLRHHGLTAGRVPRLIGDLWRHYRSNGSLKRSGVRELFSRKPGGTIPDWTPSFPEWMAPDFVKRANLRERWAAGIGVTAVSFDQITFFAQSWAGFESFERLRMPVVSRFPYFDRRVMEFSMRLPDYIKLDKKLLRRSMHGLLPEEILRRKKTTPQGDILKAKLQQGLIAFPLESQIEWVADRYVIASKYVEAYRRYLDAPMTETWSSWNFLAPVVVNGWLKVNGQPREAQWLG